MIYQQNDEELSLYMNLNYKPAIEIAEEEAINTMFEENHYEDIRKRLDYDIMVTGMAVAKHEFLKGAGVKVSYVDPANVFTVIQKTLTLKIVFIGVKSKQFLLLN